MQTMYQRTTDRDQLLNGRHRQSDRVAQEEQARQSEIPLSQQRIRHMEHEMIADRSIRAISATNITHPTLGQASNFNPYRQEERPAPSWMTREWPKILPATGSVAHHRPFAIASPIFEECPLLTPATYSKRKREGKQWIAAQNGATQTQLLSKFIAILPQRARIPGLAYMERTEIAHERRSVGEFMITLDEMYGKTYSEKSRAWLDAIAEFTRPLVESGIFPGQIGSMRQSTGRT